MALGFSPQRLLLPLAFLPRNHSQRPEAGGKPGVRVGLGPGRVPAPRKEDQVPPGQSLVLEVGTSEPPAAKTGLSPRPKHSQPDSRFMARQIREPRGEVRASDL